MTLPEPASPAYQPPPESDFRGAMPEAESGGEWFEVAEPEPTSGAGGRAVLGWALAILATAWLAFSAWSAGLALGGRDLSLPALAQWTAIATGPLALLGLLWLMFGRTRRRETEAFTRSVAAMRGEARALDGLLAVVRQRIDDNHLALRSMADQLMMLGDETAGRLGAASAELDAGARRLVGHGETFDRAANNARVDLGVLLDDLPRAEATARAMAERLQAAGRTAREQATALENQVGALGEAAGETERRVDTASSLLSARLAELDAGARATAERLSAVANDSGASLDSLLGRTAEVLNEVRGGIALQSQAVTALVDEAKAGFTHAGIESAGALRDRLGEARSSLDHMAEQIARQDDSSRHLIASIAGGLAALDEQFRAFAAEGDTRSETIGGNLARLRGEMEAINLHSDGSAAGLGELAERTALLGDKLDRLAGALRDDIALALAEAEGRAGGLAEAALSVREPLTAARDLAGETLDRIASGASGVETQHDRLAALLAAVDTGVGGAERRLAELSGAIASAEDEARRLSGETGPALVAALVQVKEAAAHAAERAREAISAVVPEAAGQLSAAAREALERAVQESVAQQLGELEATAVRAVEAASGASERLVQQMLSIGQSAAALEAHLERNEGERRERDSEAFAKRVSLLIDSMHSAAIDVGKILSDDVDDKSWASYLKGDRGVFTRRAARLIGSSEARALQTHYDSDREFQDSVNRYVHDFEAMLRRVTAERDGGPLAVTLMSSDMGKLYAALAPVAGGRR
ncbi:hypothetical protein [Sphingomonas mesophila]|uniref:hypothetical protein n=1 Tax=Sphingomonas mesophila TaxID=2303576 RepID=UPI0013C3203B|nr:hypothetical protein [Sphingomonas mesophila]